MVYGHEPYDERTIYDINLEDEDPPELNRHELFDNLISAVATMSILQWPFWHILSGREQMSRH